MDRDQALGCGEFVLPSRGVALAKCRAALEAGTGPILVTGEPGVGKSWLWRRLAAGLADSRRWLAIDLTPATDPAEFFRGIGHGLGLGLAGPIRAGEARRTLARFLAEWTDDGRRWVLVVDEAQNGSDEVLEEVRVLTNRLGRPDGFASLVLVGQTPLAHRLATHPLAALEARLAERIHLRPIDADEARELLARRLPDRAWDGVEVDRLHREAEGNPHRLLRLASRSTPPKPRKSVPTQAPARPPSAAVAPPIVPARPPLLVEDGLIEVGWEPEPEPEPNRPGPNPTLPTPERSEETIHDPYAALQAWNEWTRNQGDQPPTSPIATTTPQDAESAVEADARPLPDPHPQVWAEGQQSFAPYSQLFSRLKQSH